MERREFLKVCAVVSAAMAVPFGGRAEELRLGGGSKYDPNAEYGNVIMVQQGREYSTDFVIRAAEVCIEDANKVLPRGIWYELRLRVPTDYGRNKGIAWYSSPKVGKGEIINSYKQATSKEHFYKYGYGIIARLQTRG